MKQQIHHTVKLSQFLHNTMYSLCNDPTFRRQRRLGRGTATQIWVSRRVTSAQHRRATSVSASLPRSASPCPVLIVS
ncbi:hypothetical protein Csa_009550, partial [Cucumis sativus]